MKYFLILFCIFFGFEIHGSSLTSGSASGSGAGNVVSINGDTSALQLITGSNNISASTAGGETTVNGTLLAPKANPTFTGTITTPATASRALVTGASSELAASATTATEIGYVSGVSSAIQTQLGTKAPSTAPTFATSTTHSYATASTVPYFDASKNLVSSAVTPTTLGYLDASSSIQTQLNAKQASDTQLTSIAGLSYTGNTLKVVRVNAGETDFELATITSGVGGSTGATDNRILRADGTGGSTLQSSALGIDDSGRLSVTTSGNVAGDIYNRSNTYAGNATAGSVFGDYTYMVASSTANQDFSIAGAWGNATLVDGNNNDTALKGAGGVVGWARGGNIIIGTAGVAYSGRGTNSRLVGVYGHGDTSVVGGGATLGTSIGGYFSSGSGASVPASGILSALVANNLSTTNDIFEGLDNGTVVFKIADGGGIYSRTNYRLDPVEYDDGNSSTADTIDWTDGSAHKSTLTGNVTYTFSNPVTGGAYVLKVLTGAGSFTVAFPATVKFPAGSNCATATTTASRADLYNFYWDGTNYYGSCSQDFTP